MFGKVLVANRGEIAMRVMRTCARIGIRTVAVYSDADRDAQHVSAADEAVRIGPAEATESYLSIPRVIEAARASGAEALHPGYGFLSERPELADACAEAGLVFIGPSAEAMRRLGDKIGARRLAAECAVPVSPGYDGDDQDAERLRAEANRIGAPLLIKAAAGGGGRGMRRVDRLVDFGAALDAATREATLAFGDGRVFLERLVERARHVEVQVLGDQHGRVVALGDRDCSLQRRHQKVIEEAPAPHLPPNQRAGMHEAAVRLATAAGYANAGTVEFLVQGNRFYLLELNARLQVEHTVTEMVTGLDLVEWQLRIAAGERLPEGWSKEGRRTKHEGRRWMLMGHAIQARIYAEEVSRDFLPAAGTVRRVRWPTGAGVRVDASITAAGQQVTQFYDPLLAKVVCWGPTRTDALARLDAALAQTLVLGVPSTGGFLRRAIGTPEFSAGGVHTGFLAEQPELANQPAPSSEVLQAACGALARGPAPWRRLTGWRQGHLAAPARFLWNGTTVMAERTWTATAQAPADSVLARGEDGQCLVEVAWQGERWVLQPDVPASPAVDAVRIARSEAASAENTSAVQVVAAGNWLVNAPLAGKAGQRAVTDGDRVEAGQPLTSVEAMKMQHQLATDRAGRVVRWLVEPGTFVRGGQPVVELGPVMSDE